MGCRASQVSKGNLQLRARLLRAEAWMGRMASVFSGSSTVPSSNTNDGLCPHAGSWGLIIGTFSSLRHHPLYAAPLFHVSKETRPKEGDCTQMLGHRREIFPKKRLAGIVRVPTLALCGGRKSNSPLGIWTTDLPHAGLRSEFTLSLWSREVKPKINLKWSGW